MPVLGAGLGGGRGRASNIVAGGLTLLGDDTALELLDGGGGGIADCSFASEKVRSAVRITSSSPFRSSTSNLKYSRRGKVFVPL